MTEPETYPECKTCGHAARHVHTNVRRCVECSGPCVTEAGWKSFGITTPWPGRRREEES